MGWSFDDLVSGAEDLWDEAKEAVGDLVDSGSEVAADVADDLGAHGVADNIRDWGDSVADQLGATPDEKKLGETEEPKELIHGEPGVIRDRAGKLEGLSANFTSAADGLAGINVGEFQGEAADAYHQKIGQEIPKWRDAATATKDAASALNAFAPIVEAAQQHAAEAIEKWKEGVRQSQQWVQACRDYDAAVSSGAETLPPKPPAEDPGKALCERAVQILNDARKARNEGAATASSAFDSAADLAPPLPPPSERVVANFQDFKDTADMFTGHAVVGLVGAVTDLGRLVRSVNLTDPYNIAHPADYLTNATAVGAGLTNMAARPDELVKGIIGTGWGEDPGQAFGTFASNFIPFGPKGTGAVRSVLSDAAGAGARDVGRTTANAASHARPAEGLATHTRPPEASVSTHPGVREPTPAAAPRDTAVPTEAPAARPDSPAPHEPASEPPRTDPVPERTPGPDQGALPDRGPDAEPRPDTPAADRTPQQHTDSPTPHERAPDSNGHRGDNGDGPRHDPDGRDPEPRQERGPDETPGPREHETTPREHETTPTDKTPETPTDKPHDTTPGEKPGETKPGETSPNKVEPANAPHKAPAAKQDPPTIRNEAPPRTDSTAPQSNSPHSPAAPARASDAAAPPARAEAPANPGRDVPVSRDTPAPKVDPPASPKPAHAAAGAADSAPRTAAAATAKEAVTPADAARAPEAVAVAERSAPPGAGEPRPPTRPGGHDGGGPHDGGKHGDGSDLDDVDHGDFPSNDELAHKADSDPSSSQEPNQTSCKGTDPVDIATGEYFLPAVDVDLPAVLGLRLTRTHKSSYQAGVWLGRSWSCTFDSRVIVTEDAVTTIDADGTMLSFDPPVGDEPSTARTGRAWRLWNAPNNGYRLQPPNSGLSYHFAPKPHLGGADLADGVIFISAITDAHNNRILFTYTDSGAPSGAVHSGGYRIGVDCSGARIRGYTLATDSESTVLRRFGYTRGDLTSVTDATGATTSFDYDDEHRMTGWTDSVGAHYDNEYDAFGRVVYQGGRNGVWASSFAYEANPDGSGSTTVHTDAVGAKIVYGFDADLRPRAVADPLGRVTRTDFNAERDPLGITDATGATTTLRYTADGMPAQVTDPLGNVTSIDYVETPAGPRPAQVTAPDGAFTVFDYDAAGNRVQMRDAAGGTWRWVYDASGAVAARIDPLDRRTVYTANAAGLPVRITDPAGLETRCRYDAFGNLAEVVGPDASTTVMSYDGAGRLTSRTAPDGSTESWTYDGEGNRTSHTNALGATTRWEYGFYDLPVVRVDADGSRTHYSYDKARRLVAVTNPAGQTWSYRYAADGMLAAQTDFNGATTSYTYDRAGRLASRTNAAGQTVALRYDAAGRLVSEASSGGEFAGESIEYAYDAAGRVTSVVMPWARAEFGYDAAGRVLSESVDGRAVQSVFNAAGEVVETFTPSGVRTSLSYDRRGLVDGLATAGRRCEITSDELGRATRLQYGTSAVDSAFDTTGRLIERRVIAGLRDLSVLNLGSGSGGAATVVAGSSYAYRADDTLAAVAAADPSAPVLGTAASFGTDVLGRLTSRRTADAVGEATVFDAAANPSIVDGDGAVSGWRYEGTRLIDDGRNRYHYDAAGRLVRMVSARLSRRDEVWHYRWDAWDRLRTVTTPDGQTFEYTYDPSGRRLSKTGDSASVVFAWHGTQLVEQATAGGEVVSWSYLPGRFTPSTQTHSSTAGSELRAGELLLDSPAAAASQAEVDRRFYALVTDHIDTPAALLNPDTGALVGRAHATMWGQTVWTGEADTPWRFPGQYHDAETGLHYNHHRFYQPGTGRYLSPDPLGLAPAPNPYAYVGNPSVLVDPMGLAPYESGSIAPHSPDEGSLFRGVPHGHPAYHDATSGVAQPWGGHVDPALHNGGNTRSEFTSWTTDESIAREVAAEGNGPGVVLRIPNADGINYSRVASPDIYGESEVLIHGTVRGAEILPWRPWP